MGFTLLRITLNKAPRTLPGGRRGGTLSRVRLPQLAQQQAEPRVLAFAVCEPGAERGVLGPQALAVDARRRGAVERRRALLSPGLFLRPACLVARLVLRRGAVRLRASAAGVAPVTPALVDA